MIDVASDSHVEETQTHPRDPLEWYLMKLLAPAEGAPRELVPGSAPAEPGFALAEPGESEDQDEGPACAAPAPEPPSEAPEMSPPAATEHAGTPHAAVAHRETLRPWQRTEEGDSEAPAAHSVSPAAEPSTPKSKPKLAIRSLVRHQKPGAGRQKLMLALIPVLAILLLSVVRHPLDAHAMVKTADAPRSEPPRPASTEVEIPWQAPAPYDQDGRDPMRTTPATALAVENAGTATEPTAPPVELALTGILYSQDKPAALIDTQVVHEGQQVSGATVEKIERDGVQFEKNGRRWNQAVKK
jgi:hypothetical protein